jgi:iron complex outermembrane recepter protein
MTRSRRRKLLIAKAQGTPPVPGRTSAARAVRWALGSLPLASAVLAASPVAFAQEQQANAGLDEVIVSAQKREENLQNVPISVQAIGTQRLQELHVQSFDDYAQYLPSVTFQSLGPSFERVYMRGVTSGDNGNHSGPLPSVGMYLDEQPITTITGPLNVHIYDVARVESLAGPQGTLYGASSQAGTIRIITNKPDPTAFKAGYDVQGTTVSHGSQGYTFEGFANMPLSPAAALRVVGWKEHDPGYIDNVPGTMTFAASGICIANTNPPPAGCQSTPELAKKRYNDTDTYGARAALKVDLNDSWTITPSVMGQKQTTDGLFAYDPGVGVLEVSHYYPESSDDRWWQAALTVEGKISNFDLLYTAAYLKRNVDQFSDYTDYSYFYDQCCSYGLYVTDNAGNLINPSQFIVGKDRYVMQTHELRLSTPKNLPVHAVVGLFWQRESHGIEQRYEVQGFADSLAVTGWPNTLWLTEQVRTDRDRAAFGEVTWDATDKLSVTGGIRFFRAINSLNGFYGFSANFSSHTGEATCFPGVAPINGAPCTNLNREVDESGNTPKVNVTYHLTQDKLIYATYSKGFRPGGVNRRGDFPPYQSDYLKNYEVGWKTSWLANTLRFNGAAFVEDWDNFQFSYLGQNGLTNVTNAGSARIKGVESDLTWAASAGLVLSGSVSILDAKLTQDFCKQLDDNGNPLSAASCPDYNLALSGTRLPITPKFKGNLTARYSFSVGDYDAHVQASYVYQSSSTSALVPAEAAALGSQDAYALANLTAGFTSHGYSFELFVTNLFDKQAALYRYAECSTLYEVSGTPISGSNLCGQRSYVGVNVPRTIGLQFGQKF